MDYRIKEKDITLTIEQEAKQMNDEIVDRLIAYRKHLKLTQQDIADATVYRREIKDAFVSKFDETEMTYEKVKMTLYLMVYFFVTYQWLNWKYDVC